MSYDDKLDSSLDLLRRLDPQNITRNLTNLCTILQNYNESDVTSDLLSSVDTPLKLVTDKSNNKQFLSCDYNRDGDSYRSPWTNQYFPEIEYDEAPFPSGDLRQLEIKANEAFDIYRDLYYENSGISSVYLWDTDDSPDALKVGFAGVVLFKKEIDNGEGKWDSIHVFEVETSNSVTFEYKLTSSVILSLNNSDNLSVSGTLTRQFEQTRKFTGSNDTGANLETFHLINLGQLVETSEYNIRNLLQEVYFDKLKDIILKDLRKYGAESDELREKQKELVKGLGM